MNKSTKHPSKIPIAITRVRKAPGEARARGGAVGKLELNKGNNKQLKRQETLRSVRTIKKVPNFKKLHKQFEAHIARSKVKKKPLTVFVEFPLKANVSSKQNISSKVYDNVTSLSDHDKVYKKDEMTITSIPSVAMVKKIKGEDHDDEDFMLKFKELCKQYKTGYFQRPVPSKHDTERLVQLHSDTDFKSLAEKAAYSQHRRCTMRHRPVVSPGYTRGMREASEAMLRSVKRCVYEPIRHQYNQLDDVRANLTDQLDCCSDRVADSFMQHANRRNTMIL